MKRIKPIIPRSDEIIRIPRCGLARFSIRETDAFAVDLILFQNARTVIDEEHRDGTGAEVPHYIDLVKKAGAPDDLSGAEAVAMVNRVAELVNELAAELGLVVARPDAASPTEPAPAAKE